MMKIFLAIATTLSLAACGAEPIWAPEAAVVASRYTHPGPTSVTLYTVLSTRNGLSYAELGSLRYKGATARHAIHGGQWRRLDRKWLGRDGPFQSLISRRLPQGPERIRV